MADANGTPRHIALYRHVRDIALFDHPLAKYGPPLLLLADALLTSLIISKVACEYSAYFLFSSSFTDCVML
jgi:alpha-1,3-mannosyltransferase